MTKTQIANWIVLIVKWCSLIGGLASSPMLAWIPPKYLPYLTLLFMAASGIKDFGNRLEEVLSPKAPDAVSAQKVNP